MLSPSAHGSCAPTVPLWAASLLSALAGAASHAEPARTAEAPGELPVIVVTPEWRPVDAQRVPKTINQYSAATLSAAGIHDTIDLQNAAPGFVFKTNAVLGQPYLRGVGSDFVSAGAESSVATFVDGVYLPRAYDSIVDFFDLERVEVLKGPQAVHLGRNVVGGAVSVITADPAYEIGGYLDLELGNYDRRRLRGAADLPLTDTLALRFAGSAAKRDGYMQNALTDRDSNDEDFYAWRVKLAYRPSEALSLLIASERQEEDSSRATSTKPMPALGVNGGIEMGGTVPAEPRGTTENVPPGISVSSTRHSARLSVQRDALELLATTAYVASDVALSLDLDGTDASFASNHPSGTSRSFAQELRLTSTAGAWSWTAGTFLLHERANQALDVRLPQAGTRNRPDADVDTRSYAVFAEGAYRFDERWRARLGLRYTHDSRRIDLTRTLDDANGTTLLTQNESRRWSAATPEVGIELTPRDGRLYYASLARGYKAGGFNTSTIQPAFDPETLTAYELGMKATTQNRRVRANVSLFHYDYENLQLNTPPTDAPAGTFPRVINAARSTINGVDAELARRSSSGAFGVSFATTLLDARFERFRSLDPNNPNVDPDRSGNRMPQAPEVSFSVGADYRWLVPRGTLSVSGEYRRQSAVYFNIYEDDALRASGYGLLNASLAYEPSASGWRMELYVRNATDELFAQTIVRNDPLGGTKYLWGAPRAFGVRFGHRW